MLLLILRRRGLKGWLEPLPRDGSGGGSGPARNATMNLKPSTKDRLITRNTWIPISRWACNLLLNYSQFSERVRSAGLSNAPAARDAMEPESAAAKTAGEDASDRDMDIHQDNAKDSDGSAQEEGWHVVQRKRYRRAGTNKESDVNGDYNNNAEAGSKAKAQTRNHARLLGRTQKTSRMPRLPAGDYKLGPMEINRGIYKAAAGIAFEERESDVICPNKTQNILVVSTCDPDRADQYRQIRPINVRGTVHEVAAYETAPEDTSKGVIKGIPLDETPGNIRAALVTARNPTVITAKKLGNTTAVIVLFSGNKVPSSVCYAGVITRCTLYRKQIDFCKQCNRIGHRSDVCPNPNDRLCPGCGALNPNRGHTWDRNCKAKYKMPFIVKQMQWARIQDDQREAPPQARGRSHSRSRSRERQRSRSTRRGSTPGRPHSRSTSTSKGPPNKGEGTSEPTQNSPPTATASSEVPVSKTAWR
ncbi:hypothetical protein HPB50_008879 [Hyalomma asiaticum]|uniref:Uncharacterized protein n=1 Tax=Hyalomma asiaticum TaxID=266040 RepID=A0ACB7RTI9_HYAAI|nr:hypothetical protein HPB50_008879 [Hyalomma asiaticum]